MLASARIVAFSLGLAVVMTFPRYLDDIRAQFLEADPMTDSSNMTHRMLDLVSGDRDDILAHKEIGVLRWWSENDLKIRLHDETGDTAGSREWC